MMANWIRTFTVYLFLVVCSLGAVDKEYPLFKYCNTTINIHSASLLVVNEGQLPVAQCDVQVKSDWSTNPGYNNEDWLMILIEGLNMLCKGQTRLQFFNGSTGSNDIISYPTEICSSTPYQTWYLIKNKMMEIRIKPGLDHPFATMKLLVTATSYEKEPGIENFICRNQLRIESSLKCDGDNNCGDFSDEVEDGCRYTKQSYRALGLGLGFGLVLPLFIIAVVGWICYKHQKARAADGETRPLRGEENAGQEPNLALTDIANPSQPSTDSGSHHQTRAKRYQNAPSSPESSLGV